MVAFKARTLGRPGPRIGLYKIDHIEDSGFGLVLESQDDVSSPGEIHPAALSELYMNLSAHTAPTVEPRRTPICQ